jgi:hypothetical protein
MFKVRERPVLFEYSPLLLKEGLKVLEGFIVSYIEAKCNSGINLA